MKVKFNALSIGTVTMHQWDFGQTLEFDDVPENSEVHFPVPNSTELAVVNVVDGNCAIPDGTLTIEKDSLRAYLYQHNTNSGRTRKTVIIRLIPRPQPEGYVYDPTDEEVLDYNDLKDRVEAIVTAAENGEYDGRDGTNGVDGQDGEDGASAYEIAVDNGFVGTEQQWLASLKGETGATGATGAKGDKGDPGETPMHTYSTTEQVVGTWIDGKPLYEKIIQKAVNLKSSTTEWVNSCVNTSDIPIDNLISFWWKTANGSSRPLFTNYNGTNIDVFFNYQPINLYTTYAVIQYTKTTDIL